MPADASTLLSDVAAELADLYPALPIVVRKREAANGRQLQGGWNLGERLPCLVVSSGDDEQVDEHGTFEEVSVGYAVLVEYVKAAAAAVPGGATPTEAAEDSDVRDRRQAIRRRLYKPRLASLPLISNVTLRPRKPYEMAGQEKAISTGQVFTFETYESRPE